MTDWAAVAAAIHAPLEPEDRASVIEPLEQLERDFRPLEQALPDRAPLWVEHPHSCLEACGTTEPGAAGRGDVDPGTGAPALCGE